MKRTLPGLALVLLWTTGCAVASVDPDAQDNADVGDGDGPTGSGGAVVIMSGGTTGSGGTLGTGSGAGTGGTLATGGNAGTGGGAPGAGGSAPGSGGADASGCTNLAHNTESGSFATTGAKCFIVDVGPEYGWQVSGGDGRTITINGTPTSAGMLPFPGDAPYLVEFSAGSLDYTSWSYW